jgi:hypothetical protein
MKQTDGTKQPGCFASWDKTELRLASQKIFSDVELFSSRLGKNTKKYSDTAGLIALRY